MAYKPSGNFSVPMQLLIPVKEKINGKQIKTYEESIRFNGRFQTFQGTEVTDNGLYYIENTAIVETWYNPLIKSDCRIKLLQTGDIYDIINTPENIEMKNQILKFKVRGVDVNV